MAPSPDLFVVCKNCQAEVSPYITECPYCGHRLRKRAPKLDKGAPPAPKRRRRPPTPSLGRLKPGEMPGLRTDGRPVATIALVLAGAIFTVLVKSAIVTDIRVFVSPLAPDAWFTPITTSFVYFSTGYEMAALTAVFIFGWLLERRHGHWAPPVVYALGTAGGIAFATTLDSGAIVLGANAGALALLGAWVVRDLLDERAKQQTEADWLGVGAAAVILLLMPVAVNDASMLASLAGAVVGLLAGLVLARRPER